jgi:LysM repeat protein
MNIRRFLLLALVLVTVMSVSGCKLPASTIPAPISTKGTEFPAPGTETMGLFETIATQTAAAAAGGQPAVNASTQVARLTATNKPGGQQQAATPAPTKTATKKSTNRHVSPTEGIPTTYTLEKGEYPYCIARRFDVSPGELLAINGLSGDSMVFEGTKLAIPQTGNSFPFARELHSHPDDYTVRSGDSIYSIACYYGDVDPMDIANKNNLDEPYSLSTGDKLHIP